MSCSNGHREAARTEGDLETILQGSPRTPTSPAARKRTATAPPCICHARHRTWRPGDTSHSRSARPRDCALPRRIPPPGVHQPPNQRSRGCPTSGRSRHRCSAGASRRRATRGPTTARFRPSWRRLCRTAGRCCAPTSRCASATPATTGAVAAPGQGDRTRRRLRPGRGRRRPPRGVGPRPDGAAAAADRGAGRAAVERPHPAPRVGPAGRELGLARPARGRHGHHRGPAHRGGVVAAARRDAAARAAPRQALRRCWPTAGASKTRWRAVGRAGAARPLRTAARPAGGRRRIEARAVARGAGRVSPRPLPRAAHGHPAARLPALRGRARPAARGRNLRAPLLAGRPL